MNSNKGGYILSVVDSINSILEGIYIKEESEEIGPANSTASHIIVLEKTDNIPPGYRKLNASDLAKGLFRVSTDEHWAEMLKHNPSNGNLYTLLEMCKNEALKENAAKILLSRDVSNPELCQIVVHVNSLSEYAGKILLNKNPTNDQLCDIMLFVKSLKEDAAKKLLDRKPSVAELSYIIQSIETETLLIKAGEMFLKSESNHQCFFTLGYIMERIGALRERAAKIILAHSPKNSSPSDSNSMYNLALCSIMRNVDFLREVAWDKFLKQPMTIEDLTYVIVNIEPLKDRAQKELENKVTIE